VSEFDKFIIHTYDKAKSGDWAYVLSEWKEIPLLAKRCSRFQRESSGWTFLHQAAYFGHDIACRELIRLGAAIGCTSSEGKTAADVAHEKGHSALASLLQRANQNKESLWLTSTDPDLLPSSNSWGEALERRALEVMMVAYAGGIVRIPDGARYYADSFERILIGWHGTYDPPCGMDGESMM